MKQETRSMTTEMVEQYRLAEKLGAWAEAVKSRTFVTTKTIADAILAEDIAYRELWKTITDTWPDTKTAQSQLRKDLSVIFEWTE